MLAFQIISILCFLASVANLVRVIAKERTGKSASATPAPRPAVARPVAPRPAPPRPATPVAKPAPVQGSTEALPAVKPATPVASTDDKAKDDLFAGLKPTDGGDEAAKKVKRLQELGFHHSIEKTSQEPKDDIGPAKPRTQTAELDDILKRIDKVLTESQGAPAAKPDAPATPQPPAAATGSTAPPASPASPVATTAATPGAEAAKAPDDGQQRLF